MTTDMKSIISENLRASATLVQFSASVWRAEVNNQKVVREAAHQANATTMDIGTFRQKLLPGADGLLKDVHSAINAARTTHYHLTLPFTRKSDDDGLRRGPRMLANPLFVEYIKTMGVHKRAVKEALDKFVTQYPDLRDKGMRALGNLANPAHYPAADAIASRFSFTFDFIPIPAGQDFQGLPKEALDFLGDQMDKRLNAMLENAMKDAWDRTYTVVSRMVERLSNEEARFHGTLVSNVKDMVRLLKAMNVTNDPNLEAIRRDMEATLCKHEPDEIRGNVTLRQSVASAADEVLKKMAAFGYTPSAPSGEDE